MVRNVLRFCIQVSQKCQEAALRYLPCWQTLWVVSDIPMLDNSSSCEPHQGGANSPPWCPQRYLEVSANISTSLPVSGHLTSSWDCDEPHSIDPQLNACHMAGDYPSLVMPYDILPSFSIQSPRMLQSIINVVQNTSRMCSHLCEPGHKNVYQSLNLEGSLSTICHLPLSSTVSNVSA